MKIKRKSPDDIRPDDRLGCPLRPSQGGLESCYKTQCGLWDNNGVNNGQCGLLSNAKSSAVAALSLHRIATSIEKIAGG